MENTAPSQPHLLRRDTSGGRIAGVASGLGNYFNVDPVLVRLAFVLLVLAGGFGVLVYLLAWLVIPPEDEARPLAAPLERRLPPTRRNLRSLIGGSVLVVGLLAFLATAGSWWLPEIEAWPLVLIALGAALLLLRARGDGAGPQAAPTSKPPEPGPADPQEPADEHGRVPEPAPAAGEPDPEDTAPLGDEASADEETDREGIGEAPRDADAAPTSGAAFALYEPRASEEDAGAADSHISRAFPVGWATLGTIIVAGAIASLLDLTGALDISAKEFLLIALALTGIGVVASTFFGRRLAAVGLVGAVALGLAVASFPSSISLASGAGERTVRPASVGELEERYELGAGKLTLDLRELDASDIEATIEADVGMGELVVLFPVDATGRIAGRVTIGEVELLGRSDSGVSVTRSVLVEGSASPFDADGARLLIDAEVGIGKLEARLAA